MAEPTPSSTTTSIDTVADALAQAARAAGAEHFDALVVESQTTGIGVRGGALEDVESTGGVDVGLRVLLGAPGEAMRQASVSGSDTSPAGLARLAERAVAMAKTSPEDPYAGLAPPERLATDVADLDLADDTVPSPDALLERARAVEAAALAVPGVTQAEGASASHSRSQVRLLTSDGFRAGWGGTRHTVGTSAFAEADGAMERDYDSHSRRHLADLPGAEEVGRTAGERAVRRLGSTQMPSGTLPVVFDRRVAPNLLSAFLRVASGPAVARGTSFLKDRMGERVWARGITIHDDPTLARGLGSRPFDGEGVGVEPVELVHDGVLREWLLNTASARQLGLSTNGRARRGVGGPPGAGPSNCWIAPGSETPEQLAAPIARGVWVAEMFGPSLNPNTGDYSVGVAGFEIVDGVPARPVSEITLAGNLLDIWESVTPASDLRFERATNSPSLRVAGMTVAGA